MGNFKIRSKINQETDNKITCMEGLNEDKKDQSGDKRKVSEIVHT